MEQKKVKTKQWSVMMKTEMKDFQDTGRPKS